jgi:hypothetical protein
MLTDHLNIGIGRRGLTAIGSCGLDLSPCLGLVTLMWVRALLSGNEGFRYHKAAALQT